MREFRCIVRAEDGGSPSLSTNRTLDFFLSDENDNAPLVLHPLQNSASPANELVPRSAEPGYTGTKVVAVDSTAGQIAWLSYRLLKATAPDLFTVGPQTGEIRTTRPETERDSLKQKLVILGKDNGRSPRFTAAMIQVLLVDVISDAYLQVEETSQSQTFGG
ncbi:hypothetical protein Y1Q_0004794 [Alligator mississippiensis]|uniref:Cadherin domain-containing protein n=1 Tax=Alligator mississippiensis TaxID=8496 RepID=A0A151NQX4_ALLMI|nr:hypothetical protein Y1Q_0004794 [Alligator mississippiensis]